MAAPVLGIDQIISATIREPVTGAWVLDAVIDADVAPSGRQTATIDDENWVGTVRRASVDNGRVTCRLVGGAGSLGADADAGTVGAKAYQSSVTLQTVLVDLLLANGESLDSSSSSLAGIQVPTWQRAQGPHRRALEAVVTKAGLSWRVLRNGNLWVGEEAWEAFDEDLVQEEEANVGDGYFVLRDAISMTPGVTYRGESIRQVVHAIDKSGVLTEAWIRPASGALSQLREHLRREADYDRPWHCQVINQRADKSLELLPDDERIRGSGIDSVIIVPGIPGCTVEVPAGAGCYIEFAGGDPSRPYVSGWDHETALTALTLDGGTVAINPSGGDTELGDTPANAVARMADVCQISMSIVVPDPTQGVALTSPAGPVTGTIGTAPLPVIAVGQILTGKANVLA